MRDDSWKDKWIERCKRCRFVGREGDLITCRRIGTCKFIEDNKMSEMYECGTCGRMLNVIEMRAQHANGKTYYTMCKACYNEKARNRMKQRKLKNAQSKTIEDN